MSEEATDWESMRARCDTWLLAIDYGCFVLSLTLIEQLCYTYIRQPTLRKWVIAQLRNPRAYYTRRGQAPQGTTAQGNKGMHVWLLCLIQPMPLPTMPMRVLWCWNIPMTILNKEKVPSLPQTPKRIKRGLYPRIYQTIDCSGFLGAKSPCLPNPSPKAFWCPPVLFYPPPPENLRLKFKHNKKV